MIPPALIMDFHLGLERFANPLNLANMIFLGILASAICFVSWNYAIKKLGVVTASVYIYLSPVVTMIASSIILHETITVTMIVGALMTVAGLVISDRL